MTATTIITTPSYPAGRQGATGSPDNAARSTSGPGGTYARPIGALFLSAFVLYGVGNGLATSGVRAASSAAGDPTTALPVGVMMMLANSAAVVGLGVLLYRNLRSYAGGTALAYLASRIVEAVFLGVGAVALLTAGHAVTGDPLLASLAPLGPIALAANAAAYQTAMLSLALGSVPMCLLLFRTRLVPRPLSAWGAAGYSVFGLGAVAEIFGLPIGVALAIPGGLFELGLGVWLLVKGFQRGANAPLPLAN